MFTAVRFEVLADVLLKIPRFYELYIVLISQVSSKFRPIVLSAGSDNPPFGLLM